MKMNPVVHFEMPYENRERLVKFYTKVFGWQIGQYVSFTDTEGNRVSMLEPVPMQSKLEE